MEKQDVVVESFIVLCYDTKKCIFRAFGARLDQAIGLNHKGIDLEMLHITRSRRTNLVNSSNCCLVASL